jgi:hypothetical protein
MQSFDLIFRNTLCFISKSVVYLVLPILLEENLINPKLSHSIATNLNIIVLKKQ